MTAASCDAAITAAQTISGSASLHPAMIGPGQVKADERHALERELEEPLRSIRPRQVL